MTQKTLILKWLEQFGRIVPAKMSGKVYMGVMFGSETSKRCREMRKAGVLTSWGEGKFEIFGLKPKLPPAYKPVDTTPKLAL